MENLVKSFKKNLFHQRHFLADILNGNINDNEIENYIEKINDIERDLNKFKKVKILIN